MKRLHTYGICITMLAVFAGGASATLPPEGCGTATVQNKAALQEGRKGGTGGWKAGVEMTPEIVRKYGTDHCFAIEPISDSIFKRISGKSFRKDCTTPRSQLRYLKVLHYNEEGKILKGEMICHKDISRDLIDIFRRLYEAKYPISRMVLIDNYNADDEASMKDNNSTCFNYRNVAGSKSKSKHSLGRAIDINPLYNPYVKRRNNGALTVRPEGATKYADRSRSFAMKIDRNDLCYKEFTKHGFTWGGNWRTVKDYQHFEK